MTSKKEIKKTGKVQKIDKDTEKELKREWVRWKRINYSKEGAVVRGLVIRK